MPERENTVYWVRRDELPRDVADSIRFLERHPLLVILLRWLIAGFFFMAILGAITILDRAWRLING
jgi:hypothetical protein